MAEILVRCPCSQQPVPTGLKAEWVVLNSLPSLAIPFICAACGQTHKWKREDAWIAGDPRMDSTKSGLRSPQPYVGDSERSSAA